MFDISVLLRICVMPVPSGFLPSPTSDQSGVLNRAPKRCAQCFLFAAPQPSQSHNTAPNQRSVDHNRLARLVMLPTAS